MADAAGEQRPEQSGPERGKAGRIGRRAAQAVYYLLTGALIAAFTVQITQQLFFADKPLATQAPYASCQDGLHALYDAIKRGREAARTAQVRHNDAELALASYRKEVQSAWRHQPGVAALCGDARGSAQSSNSSSLLDALERLRYSEEHGVRHEASELTALRHQVRVMFENQTSAAK